MWLRSVELVDMRTVEAMWGIRQVDPSGGSDLSLASQDAIAQSSTAGSCPCFFADMDS